MTMTVESGHQQRFLDHHMNPYQQHGLPQFSNPWTSSQSASAPAQQNGYINGQSGLQDASLDLDLRRSQQHQQQQQQRLQHHYQQQQLPQPNQQQQHTHHHSQQQHQSPGSQHQQPPAHHHQAHQQSQQQSHQRFQQQLQQSAPQRPTGQKPLPLGQQQLPPLPAPGIPSSSMAYGTSPLTVTAPGPGNPQGRGNVDGSYVDQRSSLLSMPHDILNMSRISQPAQHQQQQQQVPVGVATTNAGYTDPAAAYSSPSPIHPTGSAYVTSGPTPYDQMGYAPATSMRTTSPVAPNSVAAFGMDSADARRFSHPDNQLDGRRSFQEAIEAGHGILSLSQDTPRPLGYRTNPDGSRSSRGSGDSYGFPATHSASSSISGSLYNGGSIDSNITDYSTSNAGSDIDCPPGRSLPRPMINTRQPYMGSGPLSAGIHQPPAPQSMMGQFSSKQQSTAQKKHKCKVCDKRFTRPSSLQTHMYSHTGEKPFVCDFPNCGRPFSVVSNLRRHSKVHNRDGSQTSPGANSEDLTHSD